MKKIADVMSSISNDRIGTTSEVCLEHEIQVNGMKIVKEIKKITFDGEILCPLCENERASQELQEAEEGKIKRALSKRKYNVFHNQTILSDIGLLEASFKTYEAIETEEITNKKRAYQAYERYRDGETFNTWFAGDPGVGKSHLAMSILRYLNELGEQDNSCLFVSVDEMLLRIRDSFNNKDSRYTESYFVDLLSSVDYLVLDDLGAETGGTGTTKRATDFTLRVLYAIANSRQSKSTIITSNLSTEELASMYDPKLVSRLMKDIFLINFKSTVDKRPKGIEF